VTGGRTSDHPIVGKAVPRGSVPIRTGGGVTVAPVGYGFYPWGYGGLGFGGYYGGYYDPFDPFGGYGGYGGGAGGYSGYSAQDEDDGAVRIKVKPREASVYADGYYVGRVDDFDGVFQRLHLSSGPHRIEIRAPQYEPLAFEVRIDRGQTVTYRGEMKKVS
jgi:PEGA domain-containing protein